VGGSEKAGCCVVAFGGSKKSQLVAASARRDMENFICNQYGERLANLNTESIKICG